MTDEIFTTAPRGTITVPDACALYDIPRSRMKTWLHRGLLLRMGRVKGAARGGGYVLLDHAAVIHIVANPPRNGRPPKQAPPD